MNEVSSDYFKTLRTPLLAGRDFDAHDRPTSTRVAIVGEAFARRHLTVQSAVGSRIRVREGAAFAPPYEIVGVVKDMKYATLRDTSTGIVFLAQSQNTSPSKSVTFEIRVDGGAGAAVPTIRSLLTQVNPRIVLEFKTLDRQLAESLSLPRTLAALAGFFGMLALLLATIGLYGVMSYGVASRRNDIGVRIALGSTRARIVRLVLGEVGRLLTAGIGIGALLTLAAAKFISAFLYGVEPWDPTILAFSMLVLCLVGVGAALIPAVRAARLDPAEALNVD